MVTEKLLDKPAGLAGFRARRAALKEERRRQKASDNFTAKAPDCGREIPPRLNPDVPDMVDQVKSCYAGLTKWIEEFQHVIAELRDHDLLDPCESAGLLKHYDQLQEAVDAATEAILRSAEVATGRKPHAPKFDANLIADHAKYVYAVGTRDIAAMQYLLAELAGTGRIDHKEQHELQWGHCLGMWQTLYHGTTCAVRDDRTWDGAWEWSDNTHSDGRQVMAQVRVNNWQELDGNWPYNEFLCGDGPILEHPRGSLCQIAPVIDPEDEKGDHFKYHPPVQIDLENLIEQLGPHARPHWEVDYDLEAAHEAAMLELSNELANTQGSS